MIERTLVKIYAEALYEIAEQRGSIEEVRSDLEGLETLFSESKEISSFFLSPQVNRQKKKRIINIALGNVLSSLSVHFLLTLVDKNREALIPFMAGEFKEILDRIHNRIDVDVTSAVPLAEDIVQKIKDTLSRTLEKEVKLHSKTDPEILGGIIIRVEDRVMDGSLLGQLEKLKARMLGIERRRIVTNENST